MLKTASIALLLLSILAAPAQAEPPTGSMCPVGYQPNALLNVCLPPVEPVDLVREACLVGDLCVPLPAILSDGGQLPTVVYVDALCALAETACGCSHIAENLAISCTPLQVTEPAVNVTGPGRDDNSLLPQDGDNCLPTTYEAEAFANVCVVIGPEWGSGLALFADQVCVVGDICTPQPFPAPTDGEGLPWPAAVYVDALCNLPSGCGCGLYAQRLLMLCSPIQD